ncbi:MAG: hypothetical protein HUJ27_14830 [Rhodobacteraceae bacterium]|nr:hypothetical protein [Paracoccaceae bacterium]
MSILRSVPIYFLAPFSKLRDSRFKKKTTAAAGEISMSSALDKLVEQARRVRMTEPQKTEQRISFAFGTAKIENDDVTREMVAEAARRQE